MISLVVLLAVAAAVAAIVYGIDRARRSGWGRAQPAALPHRPAPGAAPPAGAQHRYEDAHTGSLSATEILRALEAEACRR